MKNLSHYLIGFQVLMLLFSICSVYLLKVFPNVNHYVLMYIIGFVGIPMNIICFFYMKGLEESASKYAYELHKAYGFEENSFDYELLNSCPEIDWDYPEHWKDNYVSELKNSNINGSVSPKS